MNLSMSRVLGAWTAAVTLLNGAVLYAALTLELPAATLAGAWFAITASAMIGTALLTRRVSVPLARISKTLDRVADNDLLARTGLNGEGEAVRVGHALDAMLDKHVATSSRIENENEQLNDSILTLLETVARLAQRDLTIKAKVREDVTGPIADALNMMVGETVAVLRDVSNLSAEVADASNLVKTESHSVIELASREREQIDIAARELAEAASNMGQIAKLARQSNSVADDTVNTTESAVAIVDRTATSINDMRNTIRETEKRIKRLGERSQEISGVVKFINDIAERTHILALNASMHAASAGEAGRGFAVVADEVQRLAETAQGATSEIATLVSNIQAETAGTVTTMNELIEQMVGGSELATQAGAIMRDTQATTAELVAMVQKIATGAVAQARVSGKLRDRTAELHDSILQTSQHLQQQSSHTDNLVDHAMDLVASVGEFNLGEADALAPA